jgi:hypothetical protein
VLKTANPVRWFELLGVRGIVVAGLLLLCNRVFDGWNAKRLAGVLDPAMRLPRTDRNRIAGGLLHDWIVMGVNFVLYGTLGLTVGRAAALLVPDQMRTKRRRPE